MRKLINKKCLACGTEFGTYKGNKIYCDRDCGQSHQYTKLNWLSRKLTTPQVAEIMKLQDKFLAENAR